MIFNTIGERVCYCRNLLGLTQNEFAILFNISKPTVARWELNIVETPHKKIKLLVQFYLQHNLLVSEEWLLLGIGIEPYLASTADKPILNFDEVTFKIFNSLRFDNESLDLYQITSNFMNPIIQYADYIVGEKNSNKESLNNKVCFFEKQTEINVGIYNSLDHRITNYFGEIIILQEHDTLGEVKWIIKR